MLNLVVATGNPGKLQEMQAYLNHLPCQLLLKPRDLEIEETGHTFMENACLKASQVAQAMNSWAIADDSGLSVDALNGAPGLYSARYAPTSDACIDRVLSELEHEQNRAAQFICAIAIAQPNGAIALQAEGTCQGEILRDRQGSGGFGYDPIFYVPSHSMTFAEMPPDIKHWSSHRGQAFQQILPGLTSLIVNALDGL